MLESGLSLTTPTKMEIIRPAFGDRPVPILSYGIPFPEAAARHILDTFQARRVYVICSRSLASKTGILEELNRVFRTSSISHVGKRVGMKPHTLWSEILEIAAEARACEADVFLTIGGGTLTDGAKAVVLVCTFQAHAVSTIRL
jgi:alcohol dehydrogenase class IV